MAKYSKNKQIFKIKVITILLFLIYIKGLKSRYEIIEKIKENVYKARNKLNNNIYSLKIVLRDQKSKEINQ